MPDLPTGTVTFLFTDIEGSTKLAQQYPDAMPALLTRHHAILHQAIDAHNGYVFQIIGDAFCAAFHSAGEALNAALDAQQFLASETWSPAPIKVRMGIHTGAAQPREDGQYSGYTTLASAQRIMSAGHGGQVLLSGATRELVRDALGPNTALLDLGDKRLKDLLRPEHLFQLAAVGLPTSFPPLNTLDSYPNNLPTQLTTFIGREKEIAEIKRELHEHRLVTLTGSGGTGKTRLSLQVAAELLEKFEHGVWFVELAPLGDPELIPQTILSAIGLNEPPGKGALELLKEYLREKNILFVLDNCEHLITAVANTANTLLNAAPKLKLMASSREALGVRGEASYPVPSLSLPDPKHLPVIAQLTQFEAVRLFIDRALLVAPHFVVNRENAPSIAQICYRLDGIPLAIELAAARVKMMSAEQISARLDDRFRLLTGGARTALPRQQTLRALIDWSYDILSEKERLLLRRLSVFAGSWTLDAAEIVCPGQADILPYDVLDLLTQLVNKSLVTVVEHSHSGETRYRMLETIRQYAREKFLEAGGSEIVRQRHLAFFVTFVERAEPELYRANLVFWSNRLEDELDNMRLALEWALAADVEAGLRIAVIPWRFWQARANVPEISSWLGQLLERYNAIDTLYSYALSTRALFFQEQGNMGQALRFATSSLQVARTLSDRPSEARALGYVGVFRMLEGNVEEALPLLESSRALYRSLGDKIGQATVTGWLAIHHSDMKRSIEFARESLGLHRELGNLSGITSTLMALARLTYWNGDLTSPAAMLEEARATARQIGHPLREIEALIGFGTLAFWQDDFERALSYYQEAIALSEKIGNQFHILWAHLHIAFAYLRQGAVDRARAQFASSVQETHAAGLTIALVFCMEGLASLHVSQGEPELAAQLYAWADAMRERIGDNRPPIEQSSVDQDLALIHSQMDDAEYGKRRAAGSQLTTEQVIELALSDG